MDYNYIYDIKNYATDFVYSNYMEALRRGDYDGHLNHHILMKIAIIFNYWHDVTFLLEKYTSHINIHEIMSDNKIISYLINEKFYDILSFLIRKDKQFTDTKILDWISDPIKQERIREIILANIQHENNIENVHKDMCERIEYLLEYHCPQLLDILIERGRRRILLEKYNMFHNCE